jgi:hypothetical protein
MKRRAEQALEAKRAQDAQAAVILANSKKETVMSDQPTQPNIMRNQNPNANQNLNVGAPSYGLPSTHTMAAEMSKQTKKPRFPRLHRKYSIEIEALKVGALSNEETEYTFISYYSTSSTALDALIELTALWQSEIQEGIPYCTIYSEFGRVQLDKASIVSLRIVEPMDTTRTSSPTTEKD